MGGPEDENTMKLAGLGLSTVLGWFFALWNGTKKRIETLSEDLNEHRVHVAATYPTKTQMDESLEKLMVQINESVATLNRRLDRIEDKIEKIRDGK